MGVRSFPARLFAPVDAASIVVFRIAFGVLVLALILYYLANDGVRELYLEPPFLFKFLFFQWVEPWPGPWLQVHYQAMGVMAAFIALGLFYRPAVALFGVSFTYFLLLERGRYLNHFYLICLLSLLLLFIPAHRTFALDARWRPALRSSTVPAWSLYLLRAQIAVVYVFAGLAKLEGDWLAGDPMRSWLAASGTFLDREWVVYLFAWGGAAFDLLVVPGLLWRRTRLAAFAAAVAFHLMNAWQFRIDIFPWLMIAATSLFLDPSWPRRVLRLRPAEAAGPGVPESLSPRRRAALALMAAYMLVQVFLPLRHFLYPGPATWTEEGALFAWRMMLALKRTGYHFKVSEVGLGGTGGTRVWNVDPARFLPPEQVGRLTTRPSLMEQYMREVDEQFARNGVSDVRIELVKDHTRFRLTDPVSGESWLVDPVENGLPTDLARRMSTTPDMLLQYARYLARRARAEGRGPVEVRAEGLVSLNGRVYQPLVDPAADLAAVSWTLRPSPWIVGLW